MIKRVSGIVLAVVLIIAVLAGCGAATKSESTANYSKASMDTAAAPAADRGVEVQFSESKSSYDGAQGATEAEMPATEPQMAMADSLIGGNGSPADVTNAILAERQIIRSANLTIEVEKFDTAFNNIESIIYGIGFIQETNINTDRYYVENEMKLIKSGSIVLRVDKSKFDSIIGKLRGVGNVFNYTTNGQDVTDQFVDTEARLRLLKMEQAKLESYLAKLDDLDKIFKAESRLTEIRYQIEGLTGNLNKMKSMVELSTITINMNEKHPGRETKPLSYGDKLMNSLKDSLLQVVEFLGDLLIIIVAAIPVLILLGLFILLGVFIYRRIPKKPHNAVIPAKPEDQQNKDA